jgi:hypothetical protein
MRLPNLQYVIDSLCSKITVETTYRIIKLRLDEGPLTASDLVALIRREDRSLDDDSAEMIAKAALEEMTVNDQVRFTPPFYSNP